MYNITKDDYKFVERPEDVMYTVELTPANGKALSTNMVKLVQGEESMMTKTVLHHYAFMWT